MSMTRADYMRTSVAARLAKGVVKTSGLYDAETAIDLFVTILADQFERDNPRFDRQKFLESALSE